VPKHYGDIDFDGVGRVINSAEPINPQDLVTKNYFEGLRYRKTATQSRTQTSFAAVAQLISDPIPAGNYVVRGVIRFQTASVNTGIGVRVGAGSAAISEIGVDWRIPRGANASTTFYTGYSQNTANDNITSDAVGAANTNYQAEFNGFLTVSTQGTIQIEFRSETNGSAVTIGIGSYFIIERLP
jgi:hypothetical protein